MSTKRKKGQFIEEFRRVLNSEEEGANWPPDLTWARAFLAGEQAAPPKSMDQEVVTALIEELLHRQDNDRLTALAAAPDKKVAKAARTALHRLRSRKVDVKLPAAAPRQRGSGVDQGRSSLPDSMATFYEPDWRRHVFLLDPEVGGAINVFWARVSAQHGMTDLELLRSMTRKELRAMMGRFKEAVELVPIQRNEAHWLISAAADKCRQTGHTLPSGHATMTTMVGGTPSGGHPAEELEPLPGAGYEQMLELYEGEELRSWVPDQNLMQRLGMHLQEVMTSRLVLDQQQRRSRLTNIVDDTLSEIFDEAGCAAGRQVMLDTAHLLMSKEKQERAGLFRAAAEVFLLPPHRAVVHPFVRQYLERLLRMDALLAGPVAPTDSAGAVAEEPEDDNEQRSSGGIILPGGRD